VGVAEIAEILGVSRQRVHALLKTHDDFPRPVADLSAGKIWLRSDVERWGRAAGRLPTPLTRDRRRG
jgi:predicted DNA-binding transcriptional regulator AlpA